MLFFQLISILVGSLIIIAAFGGVGDCWRECVPPDDPDPWSMFLPWLVIGGAFITAGIGGILVKAWRWAHAPLRDLEGSQG